MHKAHTARDTETSRVTPAEHPVLLQIPAPSLRSKGLLALHGGDVARAYCRLYPPPPRAKCCRKGLEMHCPGGTMNPPASIQTIANQTLCGRAKRRLLKLPEPPKANPAGKPSPLPSALRPGEPISI